jgi:hypothetical protein
MGKNAKKKTGKKKIRYTNENGLVQKFVFESAEAASVWKKGTKKLCTMFKQLEVLLINYEMGNRLLTSRVLVLFCTEFIGETIKFMEIPGHHMAHDVLVATTENGEWMQHLLG